MKNWQRDNRAEVNISTNQYEKKFCRTGSSFKLFNCTETEKAVISVYGFLDQFVLVALALEIFSLSK